FVFSILLAIIFYCVVFGFTYSYAVKKGAILFDSRFELIPEGNCHILGSGNLPLHKAYFSVEITMVNLVNNLFLNNLLESGQVNEESKFFRNLSPDDNAQHIVVSVPGWIRTLSENFQILFIRPVLPAHPVGGAKGFSSCDVYHK